MVNFKEFCGKIKIDFRLVRKLFEQLLKNNGGILNWKIGNRN